MIDCVNVKIFHGFLTPGIVLPIPLVPSVAVGLSLAAAQSGRDLRCC